MNNDLTQEVTNLILERDELITARKKVKAAIALLKKKEGEIVCELRKYRHKVIARKTGAPIKTINDGVRGLNEDKH